MSIKDRISFWEQKKVAQQVKPFPKSFNVQQKIPTINVAPVQSFKKPQPLPKNNLSEKPILQEPKKQLISQKVVETIQKKTQPIIRQTPIKLEIHQKIEKSDKSTQNQDQIISVKDRIKKFNNLPIPILGQNAQSCFIGSHKKRQVQKVQNQNSKKIQSQTLLAHSQPLYQVEKNEQRQMTFKQKLLIAQKSFANRNGESVLHKKIIEEPIQNRLIKENENFLSNQQHDHSETKVEKQKSQNQQSNKLFMQSMKQQGQKSTLLVGGQSNILSLETRMTRRVKRKNDQDDFDDL